MRIFHDLVFRSVHNHWLIYNTSWEDPRIDRSLLGLDRDSNAVVITGAGCNVLDYLLDDPACIHAVDINPRQNALLNLKTALIGNGRFEDLFSLFGRGASPACREVYAGIRQRLPAADRLYWDKKIRYFSGRGRRGSFYYHGGSGLFASVVAGYINGNERLQAAMWEIFEADTLERQEELYDIIEPLILGRFMSWFVGRPLVWMLNGVPRQQIQLINDQYEGGLGAYIRDKLRHVYTRVATRDNYFWHVYLKGYYTPKCSPNYLKPENFRFLGERLERINVHTSSLAAFLRERPGAYSHYVLLDHQDWLARHDPPALLEEWQLILDNSRPGTKILMRSAAIEIDFIPESVSRRLKFHPELTNGLHRLDRVGTYGALLLAEVL